MDQEEIIYDLEKDFSYNSALTLTLDLETYFKVIAHRLPKRNEYTKQKTTVLTSVYLFRLRVRRRNFGPFSSLLTLVLSPRLDSILLLSVVALAASLFTVLGLFGVLRLVESGLSLLKLVLRDAFCCLLGLCGVLL